MSEPNPKNIVHVTASDISNGRTKHVTDAEIVDIAGNKTAIGTISFQNSTIVSSATATGTFLTLTIDGTEYAIPLYTP